MEFKDIRSLQVKAFVENSSNIGFLALTIPNLKELIQYWEVSLVAYQILKTSRYRKRDWQMVVAEMAADLDIFVGCVSLPAHAAHVA